MIQCLFHYRASQALTISAFTPIIGNLDIYFGDESDEED
jgi:hypothetical protein